MRAAQRKVGVLARARVIRFTERDVIASIELHRLEHISFGDAMIVHAARIAGAEILYTEDLKHGSVLGGVSIVDPFLHRGPRGFPRGQQKGYGPGTS